MDLISDTLRVIRLRGTIFLNADFREPWCVTAPGADDLARMMPPPHEYIAICHLIVEGKCWAYVDGDSPVEVEAGDALVIPHGDAHVLGSGENHAIASPREAVGVKLPEIARMQYGGTGPVTSAICGWFAYDRHVTSPLITALPRLFRTSIRRRRSASWLESSIRYAVEEASSGREGSHAMADKLAEILFLEALRGYIEEAPPLATGWLAGLRDPLVGRALALLHERPREPWTVESLAQAAATSRTVLADRFTAIVGTPPMQYLTQWRLALAAHLLRSDALSLVEIASHVGYESGAAFSRAFKRAYGKPPGAWRRIALVET